jgi:hypothetical protein
MSVVGISYSFYLIITSTRIFNHTTTSFFLFRGLLTTEKRASGKKKLGKPKGSRDKERVLDLYREQIKEYLQLGLSLSRIRTILNPQLEKPISYPSYRYFVRQDTGLLELWDTLKGTE